MPSKKISPIKTDFLIIGGGIAGLRAAIEAGQYGDVLILNKGIKGESSSDFAQGGVAAALSDDDEGIQSHYQDTLEAGRGHCQEDAVRVLVEEGPERVRELIGWGAEFDRTENGFALAREGAHRQNRILRAKGDATGNEIVRTLHHVIEQKKNISVRNGHFAMDLFLSPDRYKGKSGNTFCQGAWVLDERTGERLLFLAKAVILATGGVGQVYQKTTNPVVATGDGIGLAISAGAVVTDMEFFQFHPTALSLPAAPSFLLSEAMRGEGAVLRNTSGKRFMDVYHPDAELAPRDIVTRAILNEMGREKYVFLDLTHLEPAFLRGRFPKIDATCLRYGIDMTREPIPVTPSAHYLMGGVLTNLKGETNIPRLYAVGEVACTGVHGANRLASNSLLEGLVFGARVGEAVGQAKSIPLEPPDDLCQSGAEFSETGFGGTDISGGNARSASKVEYLLVQKELREMMWKEVGIIRRRRSLKRAMEKWGQWQWVFSSPAMTRLACETRNMLWTSAAMIESALRRNESIGAHFLEDGPYCGAVTSNPSRKARTLLSQITKTSLAKCFLTAETADSPKPAQRA
ncbi:MAG: L-aspartate oxidase [Nitrospiria bacterium]